MDSSIEIIKETVNPHAKKNNINNHESAPFEIVYDGTASTSTQGQQKQSVKNDKRTKGKCKMLKGISPRPKSARQRQQVKFLQEEQLAEQEKKKVKHEEKLLKQKMGCDTIFIDVTEGENLNRKQRGTKRKSSEQLPPAKTAKKQAVSKSKGPKPEVGGAGSLKCKKISNDDCQIVFEWDPAKVISENQGVEEWQARNVINLFEQENTLPFIARYRKENTGNMEVEKLREIQNCYSQLKVVQEKVVKVLKSDAIKIPQEHQASLLSATTMSEIEHLTAAYKTQSKRTYAERARELGLQPAAMQILEGHHNKFVYREELFALTNPEKDGLRHIEEVEQGLQHIIADVVSKNAQVLAFVKQLVKLCKPTLECNKARRALKKDNAKSGSKSGPSDDLCAKYEHYFNYKNFAWSVKSHEILAMNRGEQQGVLSVRIVIPEEAYVSFFNFCQKQWLHVCPAHYYRAQLIMKSLEDSWERLVKPFMQRYISRQMTQSAEIAAVEVFAKNLRKLLLTPPVRGNTVLAIDPGFINGCKIAVTNPQGEKLLTTTIYPFKGKYLHDDHWTKDHNARSLREIVHKFGCELFVIGNGKGCRETETYLTKLIQEKCFEPYNVQYTIIDETGVSQYSVTQEARQELPGLDPNHISAVSLARRLQDPLLEYVKVHPMHLGVGMYQHDIPERILHASLDSVVTECVSFVGVDINVASEFILRKLAGMNKSRASQIVEFRKNKGPFVNREQLKSVKGIGLKTFEQCAGFIKILPETLEAQANRLAKYRKRVENETVNPLDKTNIHPESYDTATSFMQMVQVSAKDVGMSEFIRIVQHFMQTRSLSAVSEQCKVSVTIMQCIIDGLTQPINYDMRARFSEPLFRKGITSIQDLTLGASVTGTVKNVTEFGAFVDIGVGRDGLIHKSKIGGINLELGHIVEVAINNINPDRSRIGLVLKRVIR